MGNTRIERKMRLKHSLTWRCRCCSGGGGGGGSCRCYVFADIIWLLVVRLAKASLSLRVIPNRSKFTGALFRCDRSCHSK